MTHDQIVEKAHYYAAKPKLSPVNYRRQLNAQERSVFDAELLWYRQALVQGKDAKYSPSATLRRFVQ